MDATLGSYARELAIAEEAARSAGAVIMQHYAAASIAVETKSDTSPVTQADREANQAILDVLRAACPIDAIQSEESPDDKSRLANPRVWIIDPLDGTRDFIARTDEFAVHVALAVDGAATVGVVYQPVTDTMYSARTGFGAFRAVGGVRTRLRVSSQRSRDRWRLGVSRLHPSARLTQMLAETGLAGQAVGIGASIKHMALAGGELDAVINLGSENDWDTCAPEVVIHEAGGQLTDGDGQPFRYNQRDPMHHRGSVASNGVSHDELVALVRPYLASKAR